MAPVVHGKHLQGLVGVVGERVLVPPNSLNPALGIPDTFESTLHPARKREPHSMKLLGAE